MAARYAACLCPAEQYSLDRPPPCPVRRTTGAHLVRASVANDGWQLPSRVELAPTRDGMTPMAARQQKGITAGYVGRPRELNLVAPTWAALPPSSAVCDQPFRSNPQTNPRHKSRMRVHLPCKVEDDLAARRRGRERSERPQAPSCQSAQLLTRRWGDASSSGLCLGWGSVGEPNGWSQTAEDGVKRPRLANRGADLVWASAVGGRCSFVVLRPSVPARLMLWRYASRGGSGQPVQLGTLPAA